MPNILDKKDWSVSEFHRLDIKTRVSFISMMRSVPWPSFSSFLVATYEGSPREVKHEILATFDMIPVHRCVRFLKKIVLSETNELTQWMAFKQLCKSELHGHIPFEFFVPYATGEGYSRDIRISAVIALGQRATYSENRKLAKRHRTQVYEIVTTSKTLMGYESEFVEPFSTESFRDFPEWQRRS